jgi:hypothetical protein
MITTTCSQCGVAFACGRDDPRGCWCAQLPALDAALVDPAAGCLCMQCLAARLDPRREARRAPDQ